MIWNHLLQLQNKRSKNDFATSENIKPQQMALLLISISELANVYAPFKYWKRSHVINHELALELMAKVVLQFFEISQSLDTINDLVAKQISSEASIQILEIYNATIGLTHKFDHAQLIKALQLFFGLQLFLKIDDQALLQAIQNQKNVLEEVC